MRPLVGEAAGAALRLLLAAGTTVPAVAFVLWIGKVLRRFDVVRPEWAHPVQGCYWRWWTEVTFSGGFWSFSFPVAAFAAATIEAVCRGGWATWVAWTAVGVASAVIRCLSVRTLSLPAG